MKSEVQIQSSTEGQHFLSELKGNSKRDLLGYYYYEYFHNQGFYKWFH